MWLQQSPGQHDDCPWQQLLPQQLPGQQFEFFVQQEDPLSASAESENRDTANTASNFAFMIGILSVNRILSGSHRASCGCAVGAHTPGGLYTQVVFETEDGEMKM